MIRSLRSGAAAVCSTPHLLVVTILMFGLWAAVAEIYAALIAGSFRSVFVAAMLSIITIPFSCWLFLNFLQLAHDLRELRVPKQRQLLSGALGFILIVLWVIPCGLLALGHWSARDLLPVAMAMPAGYVVAGLWRTLAHRLATSSVGSARPPPALRTLLGPPYAPAAWRLRLFQVGLVCAALAMPPVLVGVFGGALSRSSFAAAVHAAELLGLLAATGLCWIWPLSRAVTLFSPARGALGELALLPGLGNGRQKLRQLLLAVIGVPAVGLVTLLGLCLGIVWHEELPEEIYWKVIAEFLLILIITLPMVLGQIARQQAVGAWKNLPLFMMSQIWIFSVALWTVPWGVLPFFVALRWLAWLTLAVILSGLIFVVGSAIHSVREISRRPHPFVEISS